MNAPTHMLHACAQILRDAELRTNLFAQAVFGGLAGAAIAGSHYSIADISVWFWGGLAVGVLSVAWQWHPRRLLGLAVLGGTLFMVVFVATAVGEFQSLQGVGGGVLGFAGGMVIYSLALAYWKVIPREGRASALILQMIALSSACGVIAVLVLRTPTLLQFPGVFWLAAPGGIALLLLWVLWHREVIEQIIEFIIWPMYRIRGHGPGLQAIPMRGPLLIVANHACWFDPPFLAKVLPRRLTPMMVSTFYDLPGMRFLMVYVVNAIRVQKASFRRDVPELRQAIEVLDAGGCVVIFPEGGMRRKEEAPLRRFGQGIWHLLRERPRTPVVVCWIEGNWGSYFSYFNGVPTKNKKLDFARKIDVAVGTPQEVPPAVLEDQRRTRQHFMQMCADARALLGLPTCPPPTLPESDEAEDSDAA